MMQNKLSAQEWAQICNMRTTLLQLQFLYQSLSQKIERQNLNISLHQKDRLLQLNTLYQDTNSLRQKNFKFLLIAKLESLIAIYEPIDHSIWKNLSAFTSYVKMVEEQMRQDVCKLYIGNKVMVDLNMCEKELKNIEMKIKTFLHENKATILSYNKNIQSLQELKQVWNGFEEQVKQYILDKEFKSKYFDYLKRRLMAKQQALSENIQNLKKLIQF